MEHRTETAPYDVDFALWAEGQAAALRAGRLAEIDRENVAAELEGLARSDRRAIRSHMHTIMLHLLEAEYQPERATSSWGDSIANARDAIEDLLRDSPSLTAFAVGTAGDPQTYARARRNAARETGLPIATFPKAMTRDFGTAVVNAASAGDEPPSSEPPHPLAPRLW